MANNRHPQTFGRALRDARHSRGVSMEELAYETRYLDEREGRGRGLSFSYISLLERDQRRPSPELIELLARALGTSPYEFAEYQLGLAQRLFDSQVESLSEALEYLGFLGRLVEHWSATFGDSEIPDKLNQVLARSETDGLQAATPAPAHAQQSS